MMVGPVESERRAPVERHDRPGGYAHSFRRNGYRFDSAVHLVGGCEPSPFEGGAVSADAASSGESQRWNCQS